MTASTHPGQDPCEELNSLLRHLFEEPVSKKKKRKNCLKAIREKAIFQILPTDGARVCWKIGLDRRQLGLEMEEVQIVDHG